MKDEIKDLFKLFATRNGGVKPEAVIVYRDGVSQGEFKQVWNLEPSCAVAEVLCKTMVQNWTSFSAAAAA
jgi:Piwi domain